jgi:hypothetical protein
MSGREFDKAGRRVVEIADKGGRKMVSAISLCVSPDGKEVV